MFTVTPSKAKATRKPTHKSTGLGYAFATLGLRANEARVDAIRKAAQASAVRLQELAQDSDERIDLLSDVAISTYRLLDPRQRTHRIERIQLCIVSERSRELVQDSRRSWLSHSDGFDQSVDDSLRSA
jgi:hypothetical protein